jgi:putative ABC transport system permease protein
LSFGARRYCDLPDPLGRARRGARIVSGIDSKRAIFGLRPLTDVVDSAFDQPRLDAAILSSFASAALALAGIGLYSLFMLVVADRTREIAVRLAIGASPAEMIRLVAAAAAGCWQAGSSWVSD